MDFSQLIAQQTQLPRAGVHATLSLLDDKATIPFIARYRKEKTGSLDEVQIAAIAELYRKYQEMADRKATILATIQEQGKLTDDLRRRIDECWDATALEDLYLPYKPHRKTRADLAREKGLQPLADEIMRQRSDFNPRRYSEEQLQGARDIIAEQISQDERARNAIRRAFTYTAVISSKPVKDKADTPEAQNYRDYFNVSEPLKRISAHRLLAMRRAEKEGFIRVDISPNTNECLDKLDRIFLRANNYAADQVADALEDSYKRLLKPSIETEYAALSKEKADTEAIRVFRDNLRQLLLDSPLGQKRVLALDPGFRTGCKMVVLSAQGDLLKHDVIFLRMMDSVEKLQQYARDYQIEAIAIGNGTASRETEAFVHQVLGNSIPVYVVSENGASVYSASKLAREEFPDEDVTVRGAVSIGRRLMDPLAELVKIDPKSIGVGQYQHDVDQTRLKESLNQTVESVVNYVGVDVNTASPYLLTYISGLGPTLAENIVTYRRENGPFANRQALKKVPKMGPKTFEQCAGFLRIAGGTNPLDNTAVHPERYGVAKQLIEARRLAGEGLQIDLRPFVTDEVGLPTLTDILHELEKPTRDPRTQIEEFHFDENVHTIDDLVPGMVLPGIVTNIADFGVFVDLGVHKDGLIHVSQLTDRRIRSPHEVVRLHQQIRIRILDIDRSRQRINLTMKGV
ncbi:MAG: RNA-binding transcriptional accessory protein [Paludibacteraceae bacterium]|nr:RNA-binding transcriptional accessory protein [Paludibacteraceae bacterium]